MLDAADRSMLKEKALAIVGRVEPDDVFVVEDGFDDIVDAWNAARAQDEGRFGRKQVPLRESGLSRSGVNQLIVRPPPLRGRAAVRHS